MKPHYLIGGGIILALFYLASRNQTREQPRYQTAWNDQTVAKTGWDWHSLGSDLILEPAHHITDVTTLPVRFPARSGHEISCIIHKGWDQVYKSRPQDMDWMFSPVSEDDL